MSDRIGTASVCLLLSTSLYGALAWQLYEMGGFARLMGGVIGACAFATYLVTLVLAIELKSWAWHACHAALKIQLIGAVALLVLFLGSGLASGARGVIGLLVLLVATLLCLLGLWAIRRPASRAICSVDGAIAQA